MSSSFTVFGFMAGRSMTISPNPGLNSGLYMGMVPNWLDSLLKLFQCGRFRGLGFGVLGFKV